MAPSVVGSQNDKDEKNKKNKMPILIWPEWTEQDINQEKWVSVLKSSQIIIEQCNNLVIDSVTLDFQSPESLKKSR